MEPGVTVTQTNSGSGDVYADVPPDLVGYAQALGVNNQFSWLQNLALPAVQAAANILLLEWQSDRYDEIESDRLGYIDEAYEYLCECYNDLIQRFEYTVDDIPTPAMYQPVQPAGEQLESIRANWESIPYSDELIKQLNGKNREQDLIRAVALNPKYYEMTKETWCSIASLIRGELLEQQVITIMGDQTATDLLNGRLGNNCRITHRALGVEVVNTEARGRIEQRAERASMSQDISPIARMGDIRDMFLSPVQMIGVGVQQAQYLQNAEQNAFNACAKKAPYLAQELSFKLNECLQKMQLILSKSNAINTFAPNVQSIFNSQVRDITNGLFGSFSNDNGATRIGNGISNGVSSLFNNGATTGIAPIGDAK